MGNVEFSDGSTQTLGSAAIQIHPHYKYYSYSDSLAMITLEQPVIITPVCMDFKAPGSMGNIHDRKLTLPTKNFCRKLHSRVFRGLVLESDAFCVSSTVQLNEGGLPLSVVQDGRYSLIGLSNYGGDVG